MPGEPRDPETLQELYSYALTLGPGCAFDTADFAVACRLPAAQAAEGLNRLVAMGLLRGRPDGRLVAVAPDEAVTDVVNPLEREMRAQRLRIERTRTTLMSFMPLFEASLTAHHHPAQFEVIEDLPQVLATIAELTAASREEILTAQPGGGRAEIELEEAVPRDEETLKRGVRMRILYQHTARLSQGTGAYVERVTGLGAQVRTLDDHFTRLLVFDRSAAIISVPGNLEAAAVVREPNVVAFIADTYERLWLTGQPFTPDTDIRDGLEDSLREAIVRLLAAGMTDASIALRLGMSVRTCRRHIADLMTELNAQSRFQAGYALAARSPKPEQ